MEKRYVDVVLIKTFLVKKPLLPCGSIFSTIYVLTLEWSVKSHILLYNLCML